MHLHPIYRYDLHILAWAIGSIILALVFIYTAKSGGPKDGNKI